MKPISLLRPLLVALLPLAALAAPFDPGQTLEIELDDPADSVSLNELGYFTQAVEKVLAERGYAGEFEVNRYSGASQTDTGPLVHVRLVRWDTFVPTEFECRVYVTAIADGKDYDLGVHVGRTDAFAPTLNQKERRLVDSAANAMQKVYDALLEQGLLVQE
ncbi:MAG: hypothetical protein ACLFU2_00260 [Opitutales bacterium]